MILRLRSRVPLVLSILSLGIGLAMSAAAQGQVQITNISQPVTQREFYTVLASGFVFIVLGTAGAVKFMFSTALHDLRGLVETLRESVSRFEDRLYNHNESATAHATASDHVHAPMNERIDTLRSDLDAAIRHCESIRGCVLELPPRAKRRATDPHTGGPDDSGPDFRLGDVAGEP